MMRGLTLRNRLAVSFALALAIAYIAIAICAVFVMHRTLRGAVDSRLTIVAQSIAAIANDNAGDIDREDRQQFATIAADASGAIVLDSNDAIILGTTPDMPAWLPAALPRAKLGDVFAVKSDHRELRAIVMRRRKHHVNNRIIVWQSMQLVHDVERPVLLVVGACGLLVLIGGYAASAQIAKRGLLPLTRVTAIVAEIAAHDLTLRVGPQPHADELGLLAATFDRMLDRLQAAFERQRQFTADASHDLRAPLSTLRAEVDLALRAQRTNAEYRAALSEIAMDADHLDRLIDALLTAARSDSGELDLHPLALDALAATGAAEIAPLARAKNVTIAADIAPGVQILGDAGLLGRALLAALHNAVKYTPANRSIHVSVTPGPDRARLCVHDEGPGFSEAALLHAFDRFWRDDSARGRGGSGLGLAIAQRIVERCGGEISIANGVSGGAQVTMTFPLRPSLQPNTVHPVG